MSAEEVYVARPFRLIALFCAFLALCLDAVALWSPYWVTAESFSLSLWESCRRSVSAWRCTSTLRSGTALISTLHTSLVLNVAPDNTLLTRFQSGCCKSLIADSCYCCTRFRKLAYVGVTVRLSVICRLFTCHLQLSIKQTFFLHRGLLKIYLVTDQAKSVFI